MISLITRTTVCGVSLLTIRWMIRMLTVTATRMISMKYAVRSGITLNAPRPAVINIRIERMILIAFIVTPPISEITFLLLPLYHNSDKMENFSVNFFAEIQEGDITMTQSHTVSCFLNLILYW